MKKKRPIRKNIHPKKGGGVSPASESISPEPKIKESPTATWSNGMHENKTMNAPTT
ncbi:MAG: hypothetical protein GVY36_10325 [Verrucomicrobia bacterium]|nr:hypothetical protein [Verrucomicrobiota bacterium]